MNMTLSIHPAYPHNVNNDEEQIRLYEAILYELNLLCFRDNSSNLLNRIDNDTLARALAMRLYHGHGVKRT